MDDKYLKVGRAPFYDVQAGISFSVVGVGWGRGKCAYKIVDNKPTSRPTTLAIQNLLPRWWCQNPTETTVVSKNSSSISCKLCCYTNK